MNKKYLKWLLKERKITLIFFLFLYIAVAIVGSSYGDGFRWYSISERAMVFSMILAYVLPLITFSYVHNRQSTDVRFALPVSRREMCITQIVFCAGINFLFWFVTTVLGLLFSGGIDLIFFLDLTGHTLLWITAVTVMNTLFFLTANNLTDGIIMTAAYNVLPAVCLSAAEEFFVNLIAGSTYASLHLDFSWLSPLASGIANENVLIDFVAGKTHEGFSLFYVCVLIVYVILGCIGLYHHFVRRKTERADQISDDIMAYPAIIHIYLVLSMIFIASNSAFDLSSSLISWLVLLIIYVIAMFVYKRRIALTPKILGIYAACAVIVLALGQAAVMTKGFGIPLQYHTFEKEYYTCAYNFNANSHGSLDQPSDSNIAYVNFAVSIPKAEKDQYAELLEILERNRKANIEAFYDRKNHEEQWHGQLIFADSDLPVTSDQDYYYGAVNSDYEYHVYVPFTEAELKTISKYRTIYVYTDDGNHMTVEEYFEKRK